MLEKIKEYIARISIFTKTGYINPKYVFLAKITASTKQENTELLWAGASKYTNKGDYIYDRLFIAITELETLKKIYVEKEENK